MPENLRPQALGKPEHIDRSMTTCLRGLNRIVLIVHGAGRAREVVNLVDLNKQRKRDVVPHQLKVRVPEQMGHVLLGAREEIVNTKHVMPPCNQPFA